MSCYFRTNRTISKYKNNFFISILSGNTMILTSIAFLIGYALCPPRYFAWNTTSGLLLEGDGYDDGRELLLKLLHA